MPRRNRKGNRPPGPQPAGQRRGPPTTGNGDYRTAGRAVVNTVRQLQNAQRNGRTRRSVAKTLLREAALGAARGVIGVGDYHDVEYLTNGLINPDPAQPTGPIVRNNGRRGTYLDDSEYIGDIYSGAMGVSSTLFTNRVYDVNPANAELFPWLSTIAGNFDQWYPHQIIFRFKSTSSEFNGATQALGTISLAMDYDNADAPYANRQELENSDHAVSCKASENVRFGVECRETERPTRVLFTGPRFTGSSVSASFYNLGKFQLATQGMSAPGIVLGELWVDYKITFYKKQLNRSPAVNYPWSEFYTSADIPADTSFVQGMLLEDGTAGWQVSESSVYSDTITAGKWAVFVRYDTPSAFDHHAPEITAVTNAAAPGSPVIRWLGGPANPVMQAVFVIYVTAPRPSFSLTGVATSLTGPRRITIAAVDVNATF